MRRRRVLQRHGHVRGNRVQRPFRRPLRRRPRVSADLCVLSLCRSGGNALHR
jgi:hypothetical protein